MPSPLVTDVCREQAVALDHVASLNHPDVPLPLDDRACVLLVLTYGNAVAEVCDAMQVEGDPEPALLFARWAEEVVTLTARWYHGEPLARSAFQTITEDVFAAEDDELPEAVEMAALRAEQGAEPHNLIDVLYLATGCTIGEIVARAHEVNAPTIPALSAAQKASGLDWTTFVKVGPR